MKAIIITILTLAGFSTFIYLKKTKPDISQEQKSTKILEKTTENNQEIYTKLEKSKEKLKPIKNNISTPAASSKSGAEKRKGSKKFKELLEDDIEFIEMT